MRTRIVRFLAIVFCFCAVLSAADAGSPRKLLQWYGRRYNTGNAQLAANQAALVNTQYAIRTAVESGANPRVTQDAAFYGSDQAWLAANYNRFGRWGWWGKK